MRRWMNVLRTPLGLAATVLTVGVLVLAVLTVSYASSLKAYLQQRQHIAELRSQIAQSEADIDALEREKSRWRDPAFVQSQARVAAAVAAGKFAEEIVPFTTTMKVADKATGATHEQEVTLERDEGPRPDTTLAKLATLEPDVIVIRVVSMRTVVDLPAPFGPRNPNTCPSSTCRSTPRTASTAPPRPV